MQRLQQDYQKNIAPKLKTAMGLKTVLAVPRFEKIVVNVGIGKIAKDQKVIDTVISDIAAITGQRPVTTTARKSIAGFKLREGQQVGVKVTLRGQKMYSFLDRLINVALPRVRDFRGIKPSGFDGRGNFHLGLKEHAVFPELSGDSLEHTFGMEVSIVTSAKDDKSAQLLLEAFNFPFVKLP
jgi:large subunit ribosomal protein L5